MADDVTDNSSTKVWDPNDPANPNYQAPQVVQSQPSQQLKDNGTDVNLALGMPTAVLPTEQQTMADIQLQNQQADLYAAVKRGDRVRVEELLDRGADVNRADNSGTTAMMNAVENNDSNISREFVQQKSNGNISYDPNADQNLTGGMPTTPFTGDPNAPVDASGNPNPNAAGTDNASAANVATAVSQGVTAEEAEAQGNYALAAQLRAQDNLAQEALEQNDVAASDTSDGDMSYAASVADSYGGYYEDPYADYYGDDDDWYGDDYDMYGYDDYGYDDYGYDDYGYDDYGYNDYYDDPYSFSSDDYDPYAFGATDDEFALSDPSDPMSFDLGDPSLTGGTGTTSAFSIQDPTLNDPFMSSFIPQATDLANSFGNYTTPSLTGGTGSTSNFFDMSQPIGGTGNQTVWNTSFFDPASLQTATTVANDVTNNLAMTIPPTNPYYKPSSGASMSM